MSKYNQFVWLAARTPEATLPDIVTLLDVKGEHTFAVFRFREYSRYVTTLEIEGRVDEKHYLRTHGDVRAAIERGSVAGATQHYVPQGYFERRVVKFDAAALEASAALLHGKPER